LQAVGSGRFRIVSERYGLPFGTQKGKDYFFGPQWCTGLEVKDIGAESHCPFEDVSAKNLFGGSGLLFGPNRD